MGAGRVDGSSLAVAEQIRVDDEVFAISSCRYGDAEEQQRGPKKVP